MTLKILFITSDRPTFSPTQPLSRAAGLLGEFATRHTVTLAYFANNPPSQTEDTTLAELSIRVVEAPIARAGWLGRFGAFSRKETELKEKLLALSERFDLIQGDGLASLGLSGELAKIWGIPAHIWLRPGENPPRSSGASLNIIVANQVADYKWLPDGLDTSFFSRQTPVNIMSSEIIFQHIPGETASEEALTFLQSEAWPQVRRLNPNARLLIVTPGPAGFEEVEEGLEGVNRVRAAPDLRPLYERCRLAVLPYQRTPTNYHPILEAWAMQMPLVTTREGAATLPDLQLGDHYVQGVDGPSLAALIARLLEIRGPGLHLAEAARQLVEAEYSWPARAAHLESLWQ